MEQWFPVITLLVVGVLFAALGIPLWQGRVPPNPIYGVRTPTALRSESNWYHLNRLGGRWLFGIGLAQVALALVLLLWRPAPGVAIGALLAGLLGGAVLLLVVTSVAGRRLP